MTKSDFLTATAVFNKHPATYNNREVRCTVEGRVDVLLHKKLLLSWYPETKTAEIDGKALPTRKSSRLANAIISQFSPCRVYSKDKRWFLKTGSGEKLEYTNGTAEVTLN